MCRGTHSLAIRLVVGRRRSAPAFPGCAAEIGRYAPLPLSKPAPLPRFLSPSPDPVKCGRFPTPPREPERACRGYFSLKP